jgi:hypothetical protein
VLGPPAGHAGLMGQRHQLVRLRLAGKPVKLQQIPAVSQAGPSGSGLDAADLGGWA